MNNGNGGRLVYWIMNALLSIVMLGIGAWASTLSDRLTEAENKLQEYAITATNIHRDVTELKEQICLMQISIDNLREEVTQKHVYRRPCP